jgi:hypothetical protein
MIAVVLALAYRGVQQRPTGLSADLVRDLTPIPLPDSTYVGVILDPSVPGGDYLPEADALAAAREAPSAFVVGQSPVMRLMELTHDPVGPEILEGTFWVILSDDVSVPVFGPPDTEPMDITTTYAWVLVDMEGQVVEATSRLYYEGGPEPPPLID